jgi:hypothetical protein
MENGCNVHWETQGHLELATRGTTPVRKIVSIPEISQRLRDSIAFRNDAEFDLTSSGPQSRYPIVSITCHSHWPKEHKTRELASVQSISWTACAVIFSFTAQLWPSGTVGGLKPSSIFPIPPPNLPSTSCTSLGRRNGG